MANKILDGMTLEMALSHVYVNKRGTAIFLHDGACLLNPCVEYQLGQPPLTEKGMIDALTAHYAAPPAPQWREPEGNPLWVTNHDTKLVCYADTADGREAEIARTNARHWLTAWVKENDVWGTWYIWKASLDGSFVPYHAERVLLGAIGFKDEATAQHIIDHHSDKLRAVMGEGK